MSTPTRELTGTELIEKLEPGRCVAFISGPYKGKTRAQQAQNIHQAEEAAKRLWAEGYTVICPHANSRFFDGVAPEATFVAGYLNLLEAIADIVVVLPGWEQSAGSVAEVKLARSTYLPILTVEEACAKARAARVPPDPAGSEGADAVGPPAGHDSARYTGQMRRAAERLMAERT